MALDDDKLLDVLAFSKMHSLKNAREFAIGKVQV